MNNNKGYFSTPRAWLYSRLWKKHSKQLVDLLSMATYTPHSKTIGNRTYYLEKGDILAGRNFLAERWEWNESKVRRFLKRMITEKLATEKATKQTTKQTTKAKDTKATKRNTAIKVINIDVVGFSQGKSDQAEKELFDQANDQVNDHKRKRIYKEKEYIKKKGVKNTPSIFDFLDDSFKNSSGFCEAWNAWEKYRKERKLKPWVESTLKARALEFMAWGVDNTIKYINNSIANSWQGLFKPSETQDKGKPKGLSLQDFKKAYKWRNNIYPYGDLDEETRDTKILNADLETLQTKYKATYNELSEQAREPFGALRNFLNKQRR